VHGGDQHGERSLRRVLPFIEHTGRHHLAFSRAHGEKKDETRC
jgi:hypothetical protein